jgi:hypothetical protein
MQQNSPTSDKTHKMLIDGIKGLFMLGAGLLLFFFVHACSDDSSTPKTASTAPSSQGTPKAQEWYEGGTLAQATTKEWRQADFHNRLATAADMEFVLKYRKDGDDYFDKKTGAKLASIDSMEGPAMDLERCISEAARESAAKGEDQEVALVAALCGVLIENQDTTYRTKRER